jgi:hypothetical protein
VSLRTGVGAHTRNSREGRPPCLPRVLLGSETAQVRLRQGVVESEDDTEVVPPIGIKNRPFCSLYRLRGRDCELANWGGGAYAELPGRDDLCVVRE